MHFEPQVMKVFFVFAFILVAIAGFSQNLATKNEPDPHAFILVECEPRPYNMTEIRTCIGYPPIAKKAEIEGKVILRVLIDEKGNYVRHIVYHDPHPILTKAVTDHISLLRCSPAIANGAPIKYWMTIPFTICLMD
jgi:outer membrane biosynthesis protein TonB